MSGNKALGDKNDQKGSFDPEEFDVPSVKNSEEPDAMMGRKGQQYLQDSLW